jgi:multimeric flavodoxin WrbA
MTKVVAINGSPRMEKGNTAIVLTSFLQGMTDAGSDVELYYAGRIQVKPCTGEMHCWYEKAGQCHIKDGMQALYPKLSEADILVLATPVYIPLPGQMQNLINRLCPLVEPLLETRGGRTRARFREHVKIQKIALVSTGGWWERGNFTTVVRIAQELAENAGVEFAGAVLRPHASLMRAHGELTSDGKAVLEATRRAGCELAQEGEMSDETLEAISRPLVSQEDLRRMLNQACQRAARRSSG